MFKFLFVFFVIVPIIEISILMQVGEWLGAWPTVGIVIFTAWLGAKFVRQQGLSTLQSVQEKSANGEMPSEEIITGIMLLIAGILLVTPGFVTDIFGLSLLVPVVRQSMIKAAQKHMVVNQMSSVHGQSPFGPSSGDQSGAGFNGTFGTSFDSATETPINEDKQEVKPTQKSTNSKHHQGTTIEGEYERKE